ncbi:unnamed protein product [Leptidea sinapis]|uniref:MADF domain-containing protein n=1 Tax=Leptidea sinapis TaxID=189913 RepID=A0A5E4QWC9_9NEOP|nr:unnamed protein product [Leptidea sinapis]
MSPSINQIKLKNVPEKLTISLIEAVKKRPIIYDRFVTKNPLLLQSAWDDILVEVGEDNLEEVKKRWKNLKECYVKYKKSQRVMTPYNKGYRNWRWAKYIKFLDPHIVASVGKIQEVDGIYDEEYYLEDEFFDDSTASTDPIQDERTILTINGGVPIQEETKTFTPSSKVSRHPISLNRFSGERHHDDVHLLFLSYEETFRHLPRRTQVSLKLELAKLFSIAELEAISEKQE